MFSTDRNFTNKNDREVYPQSQTTDSQLSKSQNSPSEEMRLQVVNAKYQTVSNSSEEDEFLDEVLNDMLNVTFSEIDQASMVSNAAKSENRRKKDSQKTTELLFKLKKLHSLANSRNFRDFTYTSECVTNFSINPGLSTTVDHPNDETVPTRTFFLTDHENEQIPRMQAYTKTAVDIEYDKINQTPTAPNTVPNLTTHLENKKDIHDLRVENTEPVRTLPDIMERSGKSKDSEQHNEGLVRKKRKKCSRHRYGSQRKCPDNDNITFEVTVPTAYTTQQLRNYVSNLWSVRDDVAVNCFFVFIDPIFRNVICDKKQLLYECRLKAKYRSKICSKTQRCTTLSRSTETSENIDSPKQDFYQKNETESFHQILNTNETGQSPVKNLRTERIEDLLLRAVQEYQTYLKIQKKGLKINK
ncbi:hypothetical protein LOAG_17026 [Loa loa]|uniref:Uncharacterized protein n=1 Tax=Loa loa TaxID=7209 RepID=A0A1S0UM88_LOALO|nr:hypothetical protein LOAG_17026 [Loa loa]EJD75947.1 hypothetical protein LOAG_17026 [Loa loa]